MDDASKAQLVQNHSQLQSHFQDRHSSLHASIWEQLWHEGSCTPWDRGTPSPALVECLVERQDLFGPPTTVVATEEASGRAKLERRKRGLVPGCGKGYDVLLLASFGYDAYGLDVSETAVAKCKELAAKEEAEYPARDEKVGKGAVKFLSGDFFGTDWQDAIDGGIGDGFDVIYDYTVYPFPDSIPAHWLMASQFLCALPLELRSKWARRHCELLSRNGGRLVCLEYPLQKDPKSGGPPWPLSSLVYEELFARPGEDIVYGDDGRAQKKSSTSPSEEALVRVAHWQPTRSHPSGQGNEWMSIWRHC